MARKEQTQQETAQTKVEESSVEEMLLELEQIVAKLESGELSLDQSLAFFERGIALTRMGQNRLNDAQQRVDLLLAEYIENRDEQAPLTPL